MAEATLGPAIQSVRALAAAQGLQAATDRELLDSFVGQRDEAAFSALVRRHGPLVLNVCGRILQHRQDTEDAFQATFLILARKAATIRRRQALAGWLYGAAYRTALSLKRAAARRRDHVGQVATMSRRAGAPELGWQEVQALVEEEVQRLPEKYRVVFVLCCLEGHCRAETARQLGLKEGTVSSRLDHARKQLQQRLTRRGVTLSAVLAVVALSAQAGRAAVPAGLIRSTARAAASLAGTTGTATAGVSAPVAALVQKGLREMTMTRMKMITALLLAVGLLAGGAGLALRFPAPAAANDDRRGGQPAPAGGGPNSPGAEGPAPSRLDRHGDPLPDGAAARLGTVRMRLGGTIRSAVPSADGKMIFAAGPDRAVRLFETATGREVRQFSAGPETPNGFSAVALSPDGKTLAATSNRWTVLWDVASGRRIGRLEGPLVNTLPALAFSPDGKLLACGGDDAALALWDVARRQELHRLEGHQGRIAAVVFGPEGKFLVSGGADKTIRLWDPATGREVRQLEGQPTPVVALALSPDGKQLASAGEDKKVRLWDLAGGKEIRALEGHRHRVQAVAFSPDGATIASGGVYTVRLWDAASGKEVKCLDVPLDVFFVGFLGDKLLASAGADSAIHLWDTETGKEVQAREGHQGLVADLAVSPDGRFVATASWDKTVRLWDMTTAREVRRFPQPPGKEDGVEALAFAPDGKTLAAVAFKTVYLWDAATGKELRQLRTKDGARFASLAYGPDSTVVTGGFEGQIRLWDAGTGRELRGFSGRQTLIWKVAYSPDGKRIASLSGPRTGAAANGKGSSIVVWDAATGKELHQLEGALDCQGGLAFSPDGKVLAAGAAMDAIRLWDAESGRPLRTMRVSAQEYPFEFPIAFSPDGRALALGSMMDNGVYVFEAATGGLRCRFEGHRGPVRALAFSPDGRHLVSGGDDTTALVWDLTGRLSRPRGDVPLTAAEVERLWAELGDAQAEVAYRAVCRLAAAPAQALPMLKEHVPPTRAADAEVVGRWVRDLDSDTFAVREKATAELAKLGDAAEPLLRRALKDGPPPEAEKRLRRLIAVVDDPLRRLRAVRALEVLERIETAEARQVLKGLAEGAPQAWLTEEAKATLGRLARPKDRP